VAAVGPARFAAEDCRRIALMDPQNRPIAGIEDLAVLPGGGLLASAYDRLNPGGGPEGIYQVTSLQADVEAVRPILALPDRPVRPHGLAVAPSGDRFAFVNRPAPGVAEVVVAGRGEQGWAEAQSWSEVQSWAGDRYCRANDLVFEDEDSLWVTLDRGDCGMALGDLVPGAETGLMAQVKLGQAAPVALLGGWRFPNGVTPGWVAETRANRLRSREGEIIDLPGGPDNLSDSAQGTVVALHPRLIRLALYRYGFTGRAPSRMGLVDGTGRIEILWDDPEGQAFSAATVGILTHGVLIMGSVLEPGLLVCERRAA
jgi:arylesterase/paraoxonase